MAEKNNSHPSESFEKKRETVANIASSSNQTSRESVSEPSSSTAPLKNSTGQGQGAQAKKTYKDRSAFHGKGEGGSQRRSATGGGGGGGARKTSSHSQGASTDNNTTTTQGDESVPEENSRGQGQQEKRKQKKYPAKKRAPPKEDFEVRPNDVFVNEKSHFLAQVSKCKSLLKKGHSEIFLHGLGNSIPKAINIAIELKRITRNTVDYTVNTSTLQVYDDQLDLEDPEQSASTRTRNVSSIDIKISRIANFP